ncbi:THAP domain-containing protein 1-like [Dermacentor silvarum]|uniref:THAP domain-containing protein 1-like n=1 Tax=Dermacentor silvarum TaxID=543639 RepID=UPI002100ECC4|nr:THAP domain-containing protein 1-like [Dermacentor silvarum]
MPSCSAFGCRTRETDGKRLFRIPSAKRDAAQRKVWLQRISRADFNPTQWSRLCEDHFTDDQFEPVILQSCGTKKLKRQAIPSLFVHRKQLKQRKPPAKRSGVTSCSTHFSPSQERNGVVGESVITV